MFETLAANSPQSLQLIDSSIIRAHQHAAGGKKGSGQRHRPFSWRTDHQDQCRGRSGKDADTRRAVARPSFRQTIAPVLIEQLEPGRDLIADRGYERFFNELKHFRRIATRYNKTARNFWPPSCLPPLACGFRFESTT
jgi:hypothetical protein